MARMIVADHEYVTKRYNLHKLKELEELVAEAVQVRYSSRHIWKSTENVIGQYTFQ